METGGVTGTTTTVGTGTTIPAPEAELTVTATSESTTDIAEESGDCTTAADTASGNEDLSTLTSALTAASLVDSLGADFEGTIFAPNNAAFEALLTESDMTSEELLANMDLLSSVLSLHVVSGVVGRSTDLSDGQELTTSGGEIITVSVTDGGVSLVSPSGETANVITPDVEVCGGVVHIIDSVLMPAP